MNNEIVFKTKRLVIRNFDLSDKSNFFDMMGNPNVMNPIPSKTLSQKESDEKLHELITADTYISNNKSIKIIEKFMVFDKEFYNQTDKCVDRRYKLTKKEWLSANF